MFKIRPPLQSLRVLKSYCTREVYRNNLTSSIYFRYNVRKFLKIPGRFFIAVIIVFLIVGLKAIDALAYVDAFYEGSATPGLHETEKERWGFRELAEGNLISIFYARGPSGWGSEPEALEWLADNGVDILYQIWFRHENNYNILDIFYNYESCRDTVEASIDFHFDSLDPNKIWAVRLGDEEPAGGGYRWGLIEDPLPEGIAKYGSIYYEDTGDSLKPLQFMNHSEHQRFFEWANERDTWVLNWIYGNVKEKWPHLEVFQNVFARPLDWAYAEPYLLNADGFMYDHYTTHIDGFWDVYNTVRYYKTVFPDTPFHMLLWGMSSIPVKESEAPVDRVVFKKMAWASYLGGAEGIGWFQGDSSGLMYWQTTQEWALEDFDYLNSINKDLMGMTEFAPEPRILVIGLLPSGLYRIGLFKEYDTVSEDFLAMRDFELTQYDIIFVFGEVHYNEVVVKLNDYVSMGGNLALVTTLLPENPEIEYGHRDGKFLFEECGYRTEYGLSGIVTIEVEKPNTLDLEFSYVDSSFQSTTFKVTQNPDYFEPIGKYYLGGVEYTEGYPSFLYREDPDHGWIFYNGYVRYSHSHEQAMLIWNTFFRAFALNLLDKPECISTEEQEGTLITPGVMGEGELLVGMVNDTVAKSFTYTLSLDRFGFSDGTYFVYFWDGMQSYGEFTSSEGNLSFPVDLLANDVKLFLVSDHLVGIVIDDVTEGGFSLFQNYPNPFHSGTWIPYSIGNIDKEERVLIRIYDIAGRMVRELDLGKQGSGRYVSKDEAAYWDGRNSYYRKIASGIYFYRLIVGNQSRTRKMILLR